MFSTKLLRFALLAWILSATAPCARAGSVLLDGVNDYAAPSSDSGYALPVFTVETWFKRGAGGTTTFLNGRPVHPLVTRGNCQNFGLVLETNGQLTGSYVNTSSAHYAATAPVAVPIGEWHHGALTYDGVTLRLYLDGQPAAETPAPLPPATTNGALRIGQLYSASGNAANGATSGHFAEVRIWNRARDPVQIARHYREAITFAPGLLSRWGFETTAAADGLFGRGVTLWNGAALSAESAPLLNSAPTAAIVSPASGAVVALNQPLVVNVTAADADNDLARVDLYDGFTKLAQTTTSSADLAGIATGRHVLYAVAVDASGGENGSSTPCIVDVVPPPGTDGIYFNGHSGGAVGAFVSNAGHSQFTAETWFRMEGDGQPVTLNAAIGPVVALVHRGELSGFTNYFLGIRPGDTRLVGGFCASGNDVYAVGRTAIPRNEWQHAAVSFDGTFARLYLNGALEAEVRAIAVPSASAGAAPRLGVAGLSSPLGTLLNGYFHGAMDEARVWTYARAPGALLAAARASIPAATPGLRHYWRANDGTGTLLADAAPSGASLTLSGISAWVAGVESEPGIPPTATLASPGGATTVARGQTLVLSASAQDDTSVARVEFWDLTTKLGETNSAPYTFPWIPNRTGSHRVTAVAFDQGGLAGTSAPVTVTVTGEGGPGGLVFDGFQGKAQSSSSTSVPAQFTFETWFRRDQAGFAHAYDGSTLIEPLLTRSAVLGVRADDGRAFIWFGGTKKVEGTSATPVGVWRHMAVSYDGAIAKLYVDGVLEAESALTPPSTGLSFTTLGGDQMSSVRAYFAGAMDETRLWSYPRTAAEIAGSRDQAIAASAGLTARWAFSEGSGSSASSTGENAYPLNLLSAGATWGAGVAPTASAAPVVSITSPANGLSHPIGASLIFNCAASDADSAIAKVEFYLGNTKVGEDTEAPYAFTYQTDQLATARFRAVAIDTSGLTGSSAFVDVTFVAPQSAGSLFFNGTSSYVEVTPTSEFTAAQFTVEAWIRPELGSTGFFLNNSAFSGTIVPIISRGSTADGYHFLLGSFGGRLQAIFTRGGTSAARAEGATPLQFGSWQHVAATYDGRFLRVYINGVLQGESASFAGPAVTATQRLAFGTTFSSTNARAGYYRGFIGNVRLWGFARPGVSIAADLFSTSFGSDIPLANWLLNEAEPAPLASSGSVANVTINPSGIQRSVSEPSPANPVPQVTLAASSAAIVEGQSVLLTAAPSVSAGGIARVEFYSESTRLGEAESEPWSFNFLSATPGNHRLTAVAVTDKGEKAASNMVTVVIGPSAGQGAVYLDGIGDDVLLPPASSLSIGASGTIECWFRRDGAGKVLDSTQPWIPLVTRGRFTASPELHDYFLGVNGGTGQLVGLVGQALLTGTTVVPHGVWQHAALTWDSSGTRLYLNGVLEKTSFAVNGLTPTASAPAIGTSLTADGNAHGRFHGAIDEVRIWSRAQSAEQIESNRSRAVRAATGLIARWGFEEAGGSVALDSAGSNLSGTLRNSAARVAGQTLATVPLPQITLVNPGPEEVVSPPAATLEAQIAAEESTPLTYRFRGRAVARDAAPFAMVVLPSLANYTHSRNGGNPGMVDAMMDWIVANRAARNIVFVSQTGNVVDALAADAASAWANASQSFARLENEAVTGLPEGIPFSIAAGTLDLPASDPAFANTFGRSRYAGRSWFAGSNPMGTNANSLQLFTAGGIDFAVAHVAYDSTLALSSASMVWLGSILAQYADRKFIIVTHEILALDSAQNFSGNGTVFRDFLANKTNVVLLVGGRAEGEARRNLITSGGIVPVLSANFANRPQGGGGWIRLLEFSPTAGTIRSRAYSPILDSFEADHDSDFTVAWPSPVASAAFSDITPAAPVAMPGVSAAWNGLFPGRRFEWTAESDNGVDQVSAAPRTIRTAAGAQAQPPIVALTEPAAALSETLPAAIFLSATASSADDAVESVQFFVNGTCVFTDVTAPYSHVWIPGNTGTFQLSARATDRRGLSSNSESITCTILPETSSSAATVTLGAPQGVLTHYGAPTLEIQATASVPAPNSIAAVRFFLNGVPLALDAEAPFSVPMHFAEPGVYDFHAIATTTAGGSAISPLRRITIRPLSDLNVTRGPYLQMATPASMTIRWRTPVLTEGRVRYGTSPSDLTTFADEGAAGTDHEVTLSGLIPNTRYYYSVGVNGGAANNGADANTQFVTPPVPGRARHTRIWALGDSGTGQAGQKATRDGFYGFTGPRGADLLLLLGDNAYNSATDAEYQTNHFDIYAPFLRRTPSWATIGNHENDGVSSDLTFTYAKVFNHPKAGEAGGAASGTERYYSFDYANIHFISLDSMTSSRSATGPMATWLKNDLAATNARWIIAFWHHPPYSKGGWDSDTQTPQIEMRQVFNPILEQHGVDLVLGGHSHNYERSHFMSGHYGLSSTWNPATMRKLSGLGQPGIDGAYVKDISTGEANKGTVYVVAGSAASLYSASLNHPAMAVSRNQLGTAVVDVRGNQLDLKFIRDTGAVSDWFTIIKPWANADADGDGLPDEYEQEYGLNATVADGAEDADRDGVSNRDEFLAGTDPNDPQSRLAASLTPNGGDFLVRFQSVPGRLYAVERCEDLGNPVWSTVANGIAGTGNEITVADPAAGATARFYRIKVQ